MKRSTEAEAAAVYRLMSTRELRGVRHAFRELVAMRPEPFLRRRLALIDRLLADRAARELRGLEAAEPGEARDPLVG